MDDCKPISTPLDPGSKFSKDIEPKTPEDACEMKKTPYREPVGSLLYASQNTTSDISFAVSSVSRFMQNPGKGHWTAVKCIFRYLKRTAEAKLEFSRDHAMGNEGCIGYTDADWANDIRRSVTGSIFLFQGTPIAWQSKRQGSVTLSTMEAEYMTLSSSCQEALWLHSLARDLEPKMVSSLTIIFSDNKGAIDLSKNSGYRPRTKHIDTRHHFIREKIDDGEVIINYISTEEMTANALTKGLFVSKFKSCIKRMGLIFV